MSDLLEKTAFVLACLGGGSLVEAAGLVPPATWSSAAGQIISAAVLITTAAALRARDKGEKG